MADNVRARNVLRNFRQRNVDFRSLAIVGATTAAIVIPVRYVARGLPVQTTSTHLTADFIRVRSANPPSTGMVVGMQLYLPGEGQPAEVEGTIRDASFGTNAFFSAEFAGVAPETKNRIAAFLRTMDGRRACGRVQVQLPILLRDAFTAGDGLVTSLSASGLFVTTDLPRGVGSRVRGEIQLPGERDPQEFEAEVVRVAEQPKGVGLQLVGGSDEFRTKLSGYLQTLGA